MVMSMAVSKNSQGKRDNRRTRKAYNSTSLCVLGKMLGHLVQIDEPFDELWRPPGMRGLGYVDQHAVSAMMELLLHGAG